MIVANHASVDLWVCICACEYVCVCVNATGAHVRIAKLFFDHEPR